MDKAFWQSVRDHEYALPEGYSVATLTPELLSYLGSTDPELREETAYRTLLEWIDRGSYSYAESWEMATQMLHNHTIGLGKVEGDSVFLRAYSSLILTEIVYYDLTHPAFSEAEIQRLLDQSLVYLLAERDLRGYVPEKQWAHAVAHMADFLLVLSQHRFVSAHDLTRIMDTIGERIAAPVAHIYIYDEETRLVRPVMAALQRDLLTLPFLAAWLERLTHPQGRASWGASDDPHSGQNKEQTCARHNVKHFLYSLYFQLRTPGFAHLTYVTQRPAIADDLAPLVETALSQIPAWC